SSALDESSGNFQTTVPARKLVEITKAAPGGCVISFDVGTDKVKVKAGRAKFTLSSMDAEEYPIIDLGGEASAVVSTNIQLAELLNLTQFAMAQQDVRYYLNGLFFDLEGSSLTVVGTEGHRLAVAKLEVKNSGGGRQLIVPRKTVLEMLRLLDHSDDEITLSLGGDHFVFKSGSIIFKSKVIDGTYPDYRRVIPTAVNNRLVCNRVAMKEVLSRVAILANEKYRAVRFTLRQNSLSISSNNQQNEEAEEDLDVNYVGADLEIGFNASYFLDVLSALKTEDVEFNFGDSNSSCLILAPGSDNAQYVIMPMRL
ncbi:MAG: DNA polymerase III subunit beta, partial [Gammaproteobacteria bacterium]